MSTTLLYHAFGIQGYRYVRIEALSPRLVVRIDQDRSRWRCSACGGRKVVPKGRVEREFHAVPIGSKPVRVRFAVPRVCCGKCGHTRQVKLGFADPKRRYVRSFENYVLTLARSMTIKDVADHLQVSWDVVKDIQKRFLKRRYARPKLKHVRRIAIDEIGIGRWHRYLTIVMDLDSGAVLFVGEGRRSSALLPFWKRVRKSRAEIDAVAIDMSPAYFDAVSTHLPYATIVFDHFHLIQRFNMKLSDLRNDLCREVTEATSKKVLKGTRWLLLKNPEKLAANRNEQQRLEEALKLNEPLATAYYLKEELRQLWCQPDKATATTMLQSWIVRAQGTGIRMLKQFAKLLARRSFEILAWYDHHISTGPLEGLNNKIKTMKRQAYGFRDMEFFKLKILAIHKSRYAIVG